MKTSRIKLLITAIYVILISFHLMNQYPFIISSHNPIYIQRSEDLISETMIINFKFHPSSIGIGRTQVLGVQLNSLIQYNFYKKETKCILLDKSTNKTYKSFKLSAENLTSEANKTFKTKTINCINETFENGFIKEGDFQLQISNLKLMSRVIRYISLFTSTDIEENSIIIDFSPVVGSLINYNEDFYNYNYSNSSFDIAQTMENSSNLKKANGDLILRPNEKFDLTFAVKSNLNHIVSLSEYEVILEITENRIVKLDQTKNAFKVFIKYADKNAINESSQIADASFVYLKDFKVKFINTDNVIVKPNDIIEFSISNLSTLNKQHVVNDDLEFNFIVSLYTKNTYSLISRSIKQFKFTPWEFYTQIYQEDIFNIYSGGAYPIKVAFSTPEDYIVNDEKPLYVVLQNIQAIKGFKEVTFVSSTCDFSRFPEDSVKYQKLNSNSEYFSPLSYANRPICSPIRNDFNYYSLFNNSDAMNSTDYYSGSGIFFRLDFLKSSFTYYFTVWIYFDICGNSVDPYKTSNSSFITNSDNQVLLATTSNTGISFEMKMYENINIDKKYENRFEDKNLFSRGSNKENNYLEFSDEKYIYTLKCYNSLVYNQRKLINNSEVYNLADNSTKDVTIYNEINNFENIYLKTCSSCEANIYSNSGSIFISDESSASSSLNSQVVNRVIYEMNTGYALKDYFPVGIYYDSISNSYLTQKSRISIKYSSNFYTYDSESTSCDVSWNNTFSNVANISLVVSDNTTTAANNNFISTKNSLLTINKITNNIEKDKDNLDDIVRVQFLSDNNTNNFNFPGNDYYTVSTVANAYFGLYTNCIKTKATSNEIIIKSPYFNIETFIEIQSLNATSNTYYTNRIIRMTKFFTEIPIFQSYSNIYNNASIITNNIMYFHYSEAESSEKNGICILEIVSNTLRGSSSNSIFIFTKNLNLLENDFEDNNYSYPIVNINANYTRTYAFNSQLNLSKVNKNTDNYYSSMMSNLGYNGNSSYHLFLSSLLIINSNQTNINSLLKADNSSTTTITTSYLNIFIPFYCPIKPSSNPDNNIYSSKSSIIIYLGNKTSMSEAIVFNNFIYQNIITDTSTGASKNQILLIPSIKTNSSFYSEATVRFNSFKVDDTSNWNDTLYIYNGNLANSGTTGQGCSVCVLLLNKYYSFSDNTISSVTFTISDNNFTNYSYYNIGKINVNNNVFNTMIISISTSRTTYDIESGTSAGSDSLEINPVNTISNTSFVYYTNIVRPNINNMNDSIAFFCASNSTSYSGLMSNFIYYNSNPYYISRFLVDYNEDTTPFTVNYFTTDKSESVFKNDIAGSFFVEFELPGEYPTYSNNVSDIPNIDKSTSSVFQIYSDSFSSNTFCAAPVDVSSVYENIDNSAYENTSVASLTRDCWNNDLLGAIECYTPKRGTNYYDSSRGLFDSQIILNNESNAGINNSDIVINNETATDTNYKVYLCCYAINMIDTITFSDIEVSYYSIDKSPEYDSTDNNLDRVTSIFSNFNIYKGINALLNNFSYSTQQKLALEIKSKKSALIKEIAYSQSVTIGGLGKLYMLVSLPRQLTPNSVISIIGNFSNFLLSNEIIPSCRIYIRNPDSEDTGSLNTDNLESLSNNIDKENFLYVSYCDLQNLTRASIEGRIIIKLKKMIYKCSLEMSKEFIIQLSPVIVRDYLSNKTNQEEDYYINMYLDYQSIILNDTAVNFIQKQELFNYSFFEDQTTTTLSSIFPINTAKITTAISSTTTISNTSKTTIYSCDSTNSGAFIHTINIFGYKNSYLIQEDDLILKFNINLSKYKADLRNLMNLNLFFGDNKTDYSLRRSFDLNEISLFLPMKNFGEIQDDFYCLDKNFVNINCLYEINGVLNIKLKSTFKESVDELDNTNNTNSTIPNENYNYNSSNESIKNDIDELENIEFYVIGLKFVPDSIVKNSNIINYLKVPFSVNYLNQDLNLSNRRFNVLLGVFDWLSKSFNEELDYQNINDNIKSLSHVSINTVGIINKYVLKYTRNQKHLFNLSNPNPNQLSSYYFHLRFDDSFNLEYNIKDNVNYVNSNFYSTSRNNKEFTKTISKPLYIISFPSEFNLALIYNTNIVTSLTAYIEEYYYKIDTELIAYNDPEYIIIKKYPNRLFNIGNKVYIYSSETLSTTLTKDLLYNSSHKQVFKDYSLSSASEASDIVNFDIQEEISFDVSHPELYSFLFFKITINNVLNPNKELFSTNPFNIVLTDSTFTDVYHLYKNNNSYKGDFFEEGYEYDNFLLNYYKGVKIFYSEITSNSQTNQVITNSKQIIDILDYYSNTLNVPFSESFSSNEKFLIVKPGRFLSYRFKIRLINTSSNGTIISLKNSFNTSIFKTDKSDYNLSNLFSNSVDFMIGTNCATLQGKYYIEFDSTNTSNFYEIEKALVVVEASTKGMILVKDSLNILKNNFSINKAGSTFIYFYLSEPAFETMRFDFEVDDDENDSSAYINPLTITKGNDVEITFASIFSKVVTTSQMFKIKNSYTCFEFSTKSITLSPSGSVEDLSANPLLESGDISKFFTYIDYNDYLEMNKNYDFNRLEFIFSPPTTPIYLTCAVKCGIDLTTYPDDRYFYDYSKLEKSYDNNIYVVNKLIAKNEDVSIIFSNLLRGFNYNMKCVLSSMHGSTKLKTKYVVNYDTFHNSKRSDVTIATKKPSSSICHEFKFKYSLTKAKVKSILNNCQNSFKYASLQGCVVCIDSFNEAASSIDYMNTNSCYSDYVVVNTFTDNDSNYEEFESMQKYSICISPLNNCPSDYPNFKTEAINWSTYIKEGRNEDLYYLTEVIDSIVIITDEKVPDVSNLSISSASYADSLLTWSMKSDSRLKCYYLIVAGEKIIPTKSEILSCPNSNDNSMCAGIKISEVLRNYTLKVTLVSGNYSIWMVCYNDVYYHMYSSVPLKVGIVNVFLGDESR